MTNLVEILSKLDADFSGKLRVINKIQFREDFWLSVQASYSHYCIPRETVPLDEYSHFEVLTNIPYNDTPIHWIESYGDDSDTLFAYVPKAEIENLISLLDEKYGLLEELK